VDPARVAALERRLGLVQGDLGAEPLRVHRVPRFVIGEGTGQREVAGLRTRVCSAGEVEVDEVRPPAGGVALDDEDGVAPDHDRQLDAAGVRDAAHEAASALKEAQAIRAALTGAGNNVDKARALPGVVAVLTSADVPDGWYGVSPAREDDK